MVKIKSKRAQVTIFIILGLILVVSIALIFLVFRQPTLEVSPSGNPEAYIEKCMRDYGKEALNILMPQGGDIEPKGSIKYQGKDITYLCACDLLKYQPRKSAMTTSKIPAFKTPGILDAAPLLTTFSVSAVSC